MAASKKPAALAEALLSVWRQTLVERAQTVTLSGKSYPVRHTPKRNLCQVDFEFDGEAIRGLEQNPQTQSRWAAMARQGAKIMQFLSWGAISPMSPTPSSPSITARPPGRKKGTAEAERAPARRRSISALRRCP